MSKKVSNVLLRAIMSTISLCYILSLFLPYIYVENVKGSNGATINIFVLNTYHNLNTYTEKHFLKHKYLRMDKGQ